MNSAFYGALFDRLFSFDELANAAAQLFEVQPNQVLVITDPMDDSNITDHVLVLCTMRPIEGRGEFPVYLDIAKRTGFYDSDAQSSTVELLCEMLNCRALMTTEEIDPNVFFEISGVGKSREVYVDPEKRKQGIYVIREYL